MWHPTIANGRDAGCAVVSSCRVNHATVTSFTSHRTGSSERSRLMVSPNFAAREIETLMADHAHHHHDDGNSNAHDRWTTAQASATCWPRPPSTQHCREALPPSEFRQISICLFSLSMPCRSQWWTFHSAVGWSEQQCVNVFVQMSRRIHKHALRLDAQLYQESFSTCQM